MIEKLLNDTTHNNQQSKDQRATTGAQQVGDSNGNAQVQEDKEMDGNNDGP